MKKILLVIGVVASAMVLASCASKGTVDQTPAPQATTAPAHHGHHDYKGEVK